MFSGDCKHAETGGHASFPGANDWKWRLPYGDTKPLGTYIHWFKTNPDDIHNNAIILSADLNFQYFHDFPQSSAHLSYFDHKNMCYICELSVAP